MRGSRLLSGYVLKVAVQDNRWRITLLDLHENSSSTFGDFEALAVHLELEAARRAVAAIDKRVRDQE